jgi:hypothetical protein
MGSQFHLRLAAWFDEGLESGRFDVPSGRHIILNQFPRLMKEARLCASAGIDVDSLRNFVLAINPHVVTVPDGSASGLKQQLTIECGERPGLRKAFVPVLPHHTWECWFVYTPPLMAMRRSWRAARVELGLAAE